MALNNAIAFTNLNAGVLTGGTYIVQGSATLNFGTRNVTSLGAGTTVQLDGTGSAFGAVNSLASSAGIFHLLNGRSFSVPGGTFDNTGVLTVGNTAVTTFTGAVDNLSGGILQGVGTVTGAVTVRSGSTILGGAVAGGPGNLKMGDTTFLPGGKMMVQLKSWSATPIVGFDYSRVSGRPLAVLDLSALASPGQFTIDIQGLAVLNNVGPVSGFDAQAGRSWIIAQYANDLSGINPDRFLLGTANFASNNPGGSFTLTLNSSGAMILTFVPVPEPACLLAVGGALVAFVRRRRIV